MVKASAWQKWVRPIVAKALWTSSLLLAFFASSEKYWYVIQAKGLKLASKILPKYLCWCSRAFSYFPNSFRASPIFLWAMAIPMVSFSDWHIDRSSWNWFFVVMYKLEIYNYKIPHVLILLLHIFLAAGTARPVHYNNWQLPSVHLLLLLWF